MKHLIYILPFLFGSCTSLPVSTVSYSNYNKITTGHGPEDIVVDTVSCYPRMLISCDERREGITNGAIWEYNFETKLSRELAITFPSGDYVFHPHGFTLFSEDERTYLFVVNHISKKEHEIIRFRVYADSLVYEKSFRKGFVGEPNDLFAVAIDEFYYTDYKAFGGHLISVKGDSYKTIVKHFKMPNGVHVLEDSVGKPIVYVSTTLGHTIYRCNVGEMGKWNKDKIAHVKGGDNFELYNDSLLVASHSRFVKFFKHYKHKEKLSPSIVYLMHPETGEKQVIYSDTGEKVSACSTGLIYKEKLYLAQVFEPFILECTP